MLLLALAIPAIPAHAFWGGGGCGTACMAQVSGPAFSPFYQTPFLPGGSWGMTGQISYGGDYGTNLYPYYLSRAINWRGAQPMGFSYLPAMGGTLLENRYIYDQQIVPAMIQSQPFGSSRAF